MINRLKQNRGGQRAARGISNNRYGQTAEGLFGELRRIAEATAIADESAKKEKRKQARLKKICESTS